MIPWDWVLGAPIAFVCFFQAFYLVVSFRVRIGGAGPRREHPPAERATVVIPVFDSARTLDLCLTALARNDPAGIERVVVVLDHCTDDSEAVARSHVARLASGGIELDVRALGPRRTGKVEAIRAAGELVGRGPALLLDADIVLEPHAVADLLAFRSATGASFTSCLILPYQDARAHEGLPSRIICNNRLYRQSVLQSVKNLYGVANFPGGVELVDFDAYRELLVDGFLEDLTATYAVLARGGSVRILPAVLARELERQTIRGVFLQRLRWTLGAIQHVRTQIRTAKERRAPAEKVLVQSYHVMWELQHYVVVAGAFAAPFAPPLAPVLMLPFALYCAQIARSAWLTRAYYRNSVLGLVAHCVTFSAIISAALVGSLVLLARERATFFHAPELFRRDASPRA